MTQLLEPVYTQLELFRESLPKKPYCSDDLTFGLRVRPASEAVKHLYIQPNGPTNTAWLIYDLDRSTASFDWQTRHVATPNWVATNIDNGHAHLAYGLGKPVWTQYGQRDAAFRYMASIDVAMTDVLEADPGYSKLICKNPLRPDVWKVDLYQPELYDLPWLADYLDLKAYSDGRKNLPETGLGRNCTLFDHVRKWAYRKVRSDWLSMDFFIAAVAEYATAFNALHFAHPLPFREVASTAKSIAKWTWVNMPRGSFKVWGDKRRSKSIEVREGKAQEQALRIRLFLEQYPDLTQQQVADLLGIHRNTVVNALRKS